MARSFTYHIVAHAGLALSIDSTHSKIIGASQDPSDPLQRWELTFYPYNPATQQLVQGTVIYNRALDLYCAPQSVEKRRAAFALVPADARGRLHDHQHLAGHCSNPTPSVRPPTRGST